MTSSKGKPESSHIYISSVVKCVLQRRLSWLHDGGGKSVKPLLKGIEFASLWTGIILHFYQ